MNLNEVLRREPNAKDMPSLGSHEHPTNHSSLGDRVRSSASGVMRSSWGSSRLGGVASDLASLHASASKGQSTSSGLHTAPITNPQSEGYRAEVSKIHENFRSQAPNPTTTLNAQDQFNQFMASADVSRTSVTMSSLLPPNLSQLDMRKGKSRAVIDERQWTRTKYNSPISGDGAAVVALLSNTAWDIDDGPMDVWASEINDISHFNVTSYRDAVYGNFLREPQNAIHYPDTKGLDLLNIRKAQPTRHPKQYTTDQRVYIGLLDQIALEIEQDGSGEAAQKNRKPAKGAQSPTRDDADLQETPTPLTFADRKNQEIPTKERQRHGTIIATGLVPDFGDSEPKALSSHNEKGRWDSLRVSLVDSRQGLVQPWLNILDGYQDEVWGDMLPLVREAREEVKSRSPDAQAAEGPALGRLRMVLRHMDSSG